MTTDKDLEMYLEWMNEFYGDDFLHTIKKEYDIQNNDGNFDTKSKPGIKETKLN